MWQWQRQKAVWRFEVTIPVIMAAAPAPFLLTDMPSVNQSAADKAARLVALL